MGVAVLGWIANVVYPNGLADVVGGQSASSVAWSSCLASALEVAQSPLAPAGSVDLAKQAVSSGTATFVAAAAVPQRRAPVGFRPDTFDLRGVGADPDESMAMTVAAGPAATAVREPWWLARNPTPPADHQALCPSAAVSAGSAGTPGGAYIVDSQTHRPIADRPLVGAESQLMFRAPRLGWPLIRPLPGYTRGMFHATG